MKHLIDKACRYRKITVLFHTKACPLGGHHKHIQFPHLINNTIKYICIYIIQKWHRTQQRTVYTDILNQTGTAVLGQPSWPTTITVCLMVQFGDRAGTPPSLLFHKIISSQMSFCGLTMSFRAGKEKFVLMEKIVDEIPSVFNSLVAVGSLFALSEKTAYISCGSVCVLLCAWLGLKRKPHLQNR